MIQIFLEQDATDNTKMLITNLVGACYVEIPPDTPAPEEAPPYSSGELWVNTIINPNDAWYFLRIGGYEVVITLAGKGLPAAFK
jgi:hypothetical protein